LIKFSYIILCLDESMDLRQLGYFVTLAEQLHFSRAAASLDLSPSALSMQLQALERSLGVRLVNRTKRSVALTGAGELFLAEARAILAQVESAKSVARRAGRGEVGSLKVAYVISAACAGIVQRLLHAYRLQYPQVSISLVELESPEQTRLLAEGVLDACIVRAVVAEESSFDVLSLLSEPLVVALHPEHPLARKKGLRAHELADQPFVVPQFQRELGFARHLHAIGSQAGFVPEVSIQTRDFLTALTLVGAGLGVAVVPESVCRLPLPRVIYRPFIDVNEVSNLSMVVRRHDRAPTVVNLKRLAQEIATAGESLGPGNAGVAAE
jgi:DNA-binding transcriptional LysR family regulator